MAKITIAELHTRKARGEKITVLTAYDYPLAKVLDEAGVDIILVGDSLGMVVLGYETTADVTMAEMLHHAKAVRRGVVRAFVVGDMPLEALRGSREEAVQHARRFRDEAGCDAVKVEWRVGIEETARDILAAGVPVMGHVGLTPQTAAHEGGYGIRAKDARSAARVVAQAQALQEVGCFAIVLECVPGVVAQEITRRLAIPTIGIGAGPSCDGQVVVTYDLIGLFERFKPRFVRRYGNVADVIRQATGAYVRDVKAGLFPGEEHTVAMAPDEYTRLKQALNSR